MEQGHQFLSLDILLDSWLDICSDPAYEALLRVFASGQVGYAAASPSCSEDSRLKWRTDDGPQALRSSEHLTSCPGLTAWEFQQFQDSFVMLSKCVCLLTLEFQSGGHVPLEQPLNAMSWLEPVARQFLLFGGASCINVTTCPYGMDVYKAWMLATSFFPLRALVSICHDPPNSHMRIQGMLDSFDAYVSRATANYPLTLAGSFSKLIAPGLGKPAIDAAWNSLDKLMPIQGSQEYPFTQIDGGGFFSQPDWSQDQHQYKAWFKDLPTTWNYVNDDMTLTQVLVQDELDRGWVFDYPGSFQQAQEEYLTGVAIRILGVAHTNGHAPRQVVDSAVCGLNGRGIIPEQSMLPTAKEILRRFPLRQNQRPLQGFSFDVKAAHTSIVLHPEAQGLVGFSLAARLYFYQVTPFGATFSAFWWAHLGSLILRMFHQLIWPSNAGCLYVDDFLFFMEEHMKLKSEEGIDEEVSLHAL